VITRDDVLLVAHWARMELSEEEVEVLTADLNGMLQLAAELHSIDTEGVPPTMYGVNQHNVFRDDQVADSLPQEMALANAPDPKDGYFRVPKIMD